MSKQKRSSKATKRVRRTFTEEFKRDAVNLVVDQGYTLAAAVRSLGVHSNSFVPAVRIFALLNVFSREAKYGIVIRQRTHSQLEAKDHV